MAKLFCLNPSQFAVCLASCCWKAAKRTPLCRKIGEFPYVGLVSLHLPGSVMCWRRQRATPSLLLPWGCRAGTWGLWGRTVPKTALSNHRGSSDSQVWEHCGLLFRCNKCLGNLRPVEKHLYGTSSSSADAEGTVTDVTENWCLKLLKPSNKEGVLWEELWFLGVREWIYFSGRWRVVL